MKLHPSQQKLLTAISKKPEATIRELLRMTGISSTSLVNHHLTKMIVAGWIRKVNQYEILKDPGIGTSNNKRRR